MDRRTPKLTTPALLASLAAMAGCAGTPPYPFPATPRGEAVQAEPPRDRQPSAGRTVAELAMDMVGVPYRYGGDDPAVGFDCSGLVFYTYKQNGLDVPRTSQALFRAAQKIALERASHGDLVFFQDQEKLSHVGIYVGDGLFVHAPSSGKTVSVASIAAPYYQRHLVAVGRLIPN